MEHSPVSLILASPKRRDIDLLLSRLTWRRMHGVLRRLGFIASVIAWPLIASYLAARLVKKRGPSLRVGSGVNLLQQFFDQLTLAFIYGRPPHTYYMYGFHDLSKKLEAKDYITPQEFRSVVSASLEHSTELLFRDKFRFEQACQEHGLSTATTLFMAYDGRVMTLKGEPIISLPHEDLFIKLAAGLGGKDAELWFWEGQHYRASGGAELTQDALLEQFSQRSRRKKFLAQKRIKNHQAIAKYFRVTALATVRILTGRSRSGRISIICAVFKAPRINSIVDNLSSGSIGCPIDMETGILGAGYKMTSPEPHINHPDTGAPFDGFELPYWKASTALAQRAHIAFSGLAFAGWDIAITDEGPVIVEGNSFPNVESMQQAHGPLLQSKCFLELCKDHSTVSSRPSQHPA